MAFYVTLTYEQGATKRVFQTINNIIEKMIYIRHNTYNLHLFLIGVGRDNNPPPATNLTHSLYTRSPIALDLALI